MLLSTSANTVVCATESNSNEPELSQQPVEASDDNQQSNGNTSSSSSEKTQEEEKDLSQDTSSDTQAPIEQQPKEEETVSSPSDETQQGETDPSESAPSDVSQEEQKDPSEDTSSDVSQEGEKDPSESTPSDVSQEEQAPTEEESKSPKQEEETESTPFTGGAQLEIQLSSWKAGVKPVFSIDGVDLSEQNGVYTYTDALENDAKEKTVQLTIRGNGFVTYEQQVVLQKGGTTRLVFTNDASILSDKEGVVNPGFLLFGDVNGDGSIDDADFAQMAQQVEAQQTSLTQLALLPYMKSQKEIQAKPVIALMSDTIAEVKPDEKTELSGDITGLLTGSGNGVSLSAKDGELISENNPVSLTMHVKDDVALIDGFVISAPQHNAPTAGTIEVTLDDGSVISLPIESGIAPMSRMARAAATVTVEEDGSIVVNIGTQIAIKKVTITVTETSGSNKLAEISSVEFLNGMENRIPEPELNIPTNLKGEPGNESFIVSWDAQRNVTGYQIHVTKDGITQTYTSQINRFAVVSFNEKELLNGETYEVQVQSVNGDWSSPLSEKIEVTPQATRKPPAPEGIGLKAGASYIDVSWKKMKDTNTYQLYYRKKGEETYQQVDGLTTTSYRITGLETETEYEIYLTGTNQLGVGAASATHVAKTASVDPAITPNYKLINVPNEDGQTTAHIESVSYPSSAPENEFAIVDNDYKTSWILKSWDAGGYNPGKPSPIITFDQAYEMNRLVVVPDDAQVHGYSYAKTRYWDEDGNVYTLDGQFTRKTSSNGKVYYEFDYHKPFKAKKIQVNFALDWAYGDGQISIAEMKFYYYDNIEADINALYTDDMHIVLKEDVTQETIDALRERVNTPDEVSGELHPKHESLMMELDAAEDILNNQADYQIIRLDQTLTAKGSTSFAFSLNDFQPLNVVAGEGDELIIFAGQEGSATGTKLPIQIVFAQYHGESSAWQAESVQLVQGKNVITVPKISSSIANEQGGSIYVKYTGASTPDSKISVRVSGATPIAGINVRGMADADKLPAIKTYLQQLNEQVVNLQQTHDQLEEHSELDYKINTCFLNSTEIGLDDMLYSVPATQVMSGLGLTPTAGGLSEAELDRAANQMLNSLKAMDQFMLDTYKVKGIDVFSNSGVHKKPTSRLNIRYSTMFDGAFMYAGGKHIGIEFGSVSGLMSGTPIVADENGKYISGGRFGWGIAHEIGHVLDTPGVTYAEVTNNIIAQFNQTQDTPESSRIQDYSAVYKKVTSDTIGFSSNGVVALAMFWQLHLAYDQNYAFKAFDSYQEHLDNNFYSRFYKYQREPASAPNGLTLSSDRDQNIIRLASAAAQKDLTEYFTRWGLIPTEETTAYISQFPKEERPIYYINDAAHTYKLEGGKAFSDNATLTASLQHNNAIAETANRVELSLNVENAQQSEILGYEIKRNGKAVAFVTGDNTTYTDVISTVNNRVFTYEVTAYDQYLNPTNTVKLDPIKVKHDGSVTKDNWDILTNMVSDDDIQDDTQESCTPIINSAISAIKDNDFATTYTGKTTDGTNPYWIVDMKANLPISGVKLNGASTLNGMEYEILINQTSSDAASSDWTNVKSGTLSLDENGTQTIFFDKEGEENLMYTYDASYLMFRIKGHSGEEITLSEFDIIGLPGDNLELLENGIGILSEDYDLGDGEKIPAGSLIFTGSYTGNPAYNVVKLLDQNNQIINGTQIIFANVPEQGALGNVSDGTWVYYIEPEALEGMTLPTQIKAELYRVDDALTNENERLVSDTLLVIVPTELPDISLQDSNNQ